MAIELDGLKYLPELPPAGALSEADLLLVNQSGSDSQLTLGALRAWFVNVTWPVNSVMMRGDLQNPNNMYPGTTWVLDSGDALIGQCRDDMADVATYTGNHSLTLTAANIPAHTHGIGTLKVTGNGVHEHTASTASGGAHTHTGRTSTDGSHTHNFRRGWDSSTSGAGLSGNQNQSNTGTTLAAGDHSHTLTIDNGGAHTHTVTIAPGGGSHTHGLEGATASFGNGEAINLKGRARIYAFWRRTE